MLRTIPRNLTMEYLLPDRSNPAKLAAALESLAAEEPPKQDVGPSGQWLCDACGFGLSATIISTADGGTSGDNRPRQVCPNDGKNLRRMTWREAAESRQAGLERLIERINELEDKLAAEEQTPAPDSERLDWLSENLAYAMVVQNNAMGSLHSRGFGWNDPELRLAIDAAMKSERSLAPETPE